MPSYDISIVIAIYGIRTPLVGWQHFVSGYIFHDYGMAQYKPQYYVKWWFVPEWSGWNLQSSLFCLVSPDHLLIMPTHECHGTLLMISQQWVKSWLDATKQQPVILFNVDQDLLHNMESLGHSYLAWHYDEYIAKVNYELAYLCRS